MGQQQLDPRVLQLHQGWGQYDRHRPPGWATHRLRDREGESGGRAKGGAEGITLNYQFVGDWGGEGVW